MKKISFWVLIICALLVICINLILIIKINGETNKREPVSINKNSGEKSIQDEKSEEEQELEKLKKMTERDRMEYYFSEFISYIKNEEYSKAYDLLYPEFKQNYFKSVEDFREYVIKTYPDSVGFSYNNIERQGKIYVLMINIIDPDKKIGEGKSQRIVIQENDFNDFVLSFQVI